MKTILALIATAGVASTAFAGGANLLTNGSFEMPDASGGDIPGDPPGWFGFNDPNTRFTTQFIAYEGVQSYKTFGPFDFIGGGTGIVQAAPATPGQQYDGSVWAQQVTGDTLQGGNFGVFKLEFLNASGGLAAGGVAGVDIFESAPFNAASAVDTWTELTASGVAPAGTASVQAVIVQVQLGDGTGGFTGGAIFWDAASVVVPAPGAAALGMLGLVAMRRRR